MTENRTPLWKLVRRLWWDLLDPNERRLYGFWLIWQIPGLFGNMLRARYLAPRMASAGSRLTVLAGCRFRSLERLVVGDRVSIGFENFLQARGGLVLGNDVILAPGVKIWSVNHDYDDIDTPVYDQGQTNKAVTIGNDVFIGSNSFISPGVTLPDGCIVCAGSVVGAKPYPPRSVIAGNPARVIGHRGGESKQAATLKQA